MHSHLILVVDDQSLLYQIIVVLHGTIKGCNRFLSIIPFQHTYIELVSSLGKYEASFIFFVHLPAMLQRLRKETGMDYDGELREESNTLWLTSHVQSTASTPNGVGNSLTITEHSCSQIAKTHCLV